jgi:hypothetical protein
MKGLLEIACVLQKFNNQPREYEWDVHPFRLDGADVFVFCVGKTPSL